MLNKSGFPLRGACCVLATGLLAFMPATWAESAKDMGQTIAASGASGVPACASCHGAKGQGMAAAGFPYLAGQGASYLASQLQDFASGERSNPIMAPIAKGLNAEQIKAVAGYYSKLPAPFDTKALSRLIDTYPQKNAVGAWLASRGDWDHDIPACFQCHGPGAVGVGEHFPALAGLSAKYIQEQLTGWQEKKRAPGPQALMGDIAGRMSKAQISAVADYLSKLPGSGLDAVETKGARQ
ncbi:cytochrome c4 [Paralcaligenes sp. KSB-10]|uniref:c-type cytochrome n=1 Tax=Paralcaligenes sp. KSB-10 TaxID=2901142 RepID=UPI001E3A50E7|nr:c-type cytochrome [Paralcaligenes sp. KSB-10]UHL64785.1 cytochrome c4 [Paralcaligenes sp. KSB-10]